MRLARLYASLEGEANGKKEAETEHTFICYLKDLEQLKKADSKQLFEQYELRTQKDKNNGVDGCLRVRAIDNKEYILTSKVYKSNRAKCEEVEKEVSKDLFEHFKLMAPMGTKKMRYYFKVPGSSLVWEIDIYYDEDNKMQNWCRAEIEVGKLSEKLPEFPISFDKVMDQRKAKRKEGDQKTIDDLYAKTFTNHASENFLPLSE